MIVEAKDVKFSELSKQVVEGRITGVRIRGLVFHSSLAVDHIDQLRVGDAVQLNVYLTPTRKGLSGSFDVVVPLGGAQEILFGSSKARIWADEGFRRIP